MKKSIKIAGKAVRERDAGELMDAAAAYVIAVGDTPTSRRYFKQLVNRAIQLSFAAALNKIHGVSLRGRREVDDNAIMEEMKKLAAKMPEAGADKLCHTVMQKPYDDKNVQRIARKFRRNLPLKK